MNSHERYLFDYDVMIANNNTKILANATDTNAINIQYLYDYLSWHGLWWAFVLAFFTFCLLLIERRIQILEERIEYLEERLPEREPLLAKC
jgi:hypothetical protein